MAIYNKSEFSPEFTSGKSYRVSRRKPCPVCNNTDWCIYSTNGYFLRCERSSQSVPGWRYLKPMNGRSGYLFVSEDIPQTNEKRESKSELKELIERLTNPLLAGSIKAEEAPNIVELEEVDTTRTNPQTLHEVYSALLSHLSINERHLKELTDKSGTRKLSLEELERLGVKSAPSNDIPVISALLKRFSAETLLKVPGFYLNSKKEIRLNAREGLLLLSNDGKLTTGLRIRPNKRAKFKNAKGEIKEGPKYYWLASNSESIEQKGGVKGASALSRASLYTPAVYSIENAGKLGITEGEIKAFIAAQKLGYPFLSVPGVSSWGSAQVLEIAKEQGAQALTIFYDSEDNANTELQKFALADKAYELGFEVKIASWPNEFKGIDDLLLAAGEFSESLHLPGYNGLKITRVIEREELGEIKLINKATLIGSPKGTGKTNSLSVMFQEALAKQDGQTLCIGHRVSLLREAATRHNLGFYQNFDNDKDGNEALSSSAGIAITLDSLPRLNLKKLGKIKLLAIDESEQVLAHLRGATLKGKRQASLAILEHLIRKAEKVVFLDADISIVSYNFLTRLIGESNIDVVINRHAGRAKTFLAYEKKAHLRAVLVQYLEQGKKPFVVINSRVQARALGRMLEKKFPELKGWVITSENVAKPEIQEQIANINDHVAQYDYVIASPTLGTGVSIFGPNVCFDAVFVIGEAGVNTHKDLLQQAARVRAPRENIVHCWINPNKNPNLELSRSKLIKQCLDNAIETELGFEIDDITCDRYTSNLEERYLQLWADIEAQKNLSWASLAENFYTQAKREGHIIKFAPAPGADEELEQELEQEVVTKEEVKEATAEYKEAYQELETERVEGILAAPQIEEAEYLELKEKKYKTSEETHKFERHFLESFYQQPVTRELLDQDNKGKRRAQVINFMCLTIPEYAPARDLKEHQNSALMLPDLHNFTPARDMRLELLERAGLLEDRFKTFDSHSLKEFAEYVSSEEVRERIKRVLNLTVKSNIKQRPVELLSSVLEQCGIELDCEQVCTGETYLDNKGKKKYVRKREYNLSKDSFKLMQALSEARKRAQEKREEANKVS